MTPAMDRSTAHARHKLHLPAHSVFPSRCVFFNAAAATVKAAAAGVQRALALTHAATRCAGC
jgi:hypothetical protein